VSSGGGDRPESLVEAWYSVQRALSGFALAAVAGVALGVLMGRSALAAAVLGPLFSGNLSDPQDRALSDLIISSASAACPRWS